MGDYYDRFRLTSEPWISHPQLPTSTTPATIADPFVTARQHYCPRVVDFQGATREASAGRTYGSGSTTMTPNSHRFGGHAQVWHGQRDGGRLGRQVVEDVSHRSGVERVYESSAYIPGLQSHFRCHFPFLSTGHAPMRLQTETRLTSNSSSHTTNDRGYEHDVPTYCPPNPAHCAVVGQQRCPSGAVSTRDAPIGYADMASGSTRPSRPHRLSATSTFEPRPDGHCRPNQAQARTHVSGSSSPSDPSTLPVLSAAARTPTSPAFTGTTEPHFLESNRTGSDVEEENLRNQYHIPRPLTLSLDSLEDPAPGERPALPLPALVQLAIWSSPEKKLRLREIVDAVRRRFEYFKGEGGQKLANSVRHLLSLHSVFKRLPKEVEYRHHVTEMTKTGTRGKRTQNDRGRYWVLDLTQPLTHTKRPRKRRPKTQAHGSVLGSKDNKEGRDSDDDDDSANREANSRFLQLVDPQTVSSPLTDSYLSPGSSSGSPFSPYSSSGSTSSSPPLPLSDSAVSPYPGSATMTLSPLPLPEPPGKEAAPAESHYSHLPGEQTQSISSTETGNDIVPASQPDTPIVNPEAVDFGALQQQQQQQQQLLPSSFSNCNPSVHGSWPQLDLAFFGSSTSLSELFPGWGFADSYSQEPEHFRGHCDSGKSELSPQPELLAPLLFPPVQQLGSHNGYEDFAPNTQSAHSQATLPSEAMSSEQGLYTRGFDSFDHNLNF
ncbi:Forkhead box protein D2 [Marasmius tenuissimus]|nr:Forkhead box protein D2 [Marasmius tenuissimus]